MKRTLGLLCALGALLLVSTTSQAQSFDCQKAETPTEHAICNSRALSNLDMKMGTLYGVIQQLPMMMGARGNQTDAAQAFLTKRNACGSDASCLTDAYQGRNEAMETTIKDAMQDYCKAIELC
jgi:uncharacterized protein